MRGLIHSKYPMIKVSIKGREEERRVKVIKERERNQLRGRDRARNKEGERTCKIV